MKSNAKVQITSVNRGTILFQADDEGKRHKYMIEFYKLGYPLDSTK